MRRAIMDMDTWREIFETDLESRGVSDVWNFSVDKNHQQRMGWLQYVQCCFARFWCSICGRSWGSSKVHILFHMSLKKRTGEVRMYAFKQKCKMCTAAIYEEPTFLEENIEIAISNLVNKITQKFYKFPIDNLPRSFITDGQLDGPHDYNNCEACALGICNYYKDSQYSDNWHMLPMRTNQGSEQETRFPTSYTYTFSHQGSLQSQRLAFLDREEPRVEQTPFWILPLIVIAIFVYLASLYCHDNRWPK
ncbi:receptor-transporting protein 3-like [Lithobates pipiens]